MSDEQLLAVARWLKEAGYPFDWSCSIPPPELLRPYMVDVWAEEGGATRDEWELSVAEEGFWAVLGVPQPPQRSGK